MAELKDSLKTEIKTYDIEAYGKTRNDAIANCFTKLKNSTYKDVNTALINMQVQNVYIKEEKEETKVEKLFGYFLPRERKDYHIALKIICEIKYL